MRQATCEATSAGSIGSLCRTVAGQRCAAPPTAYCCRRRRAALFWLACFAAAGTHLWDPEVASGTTRARHRLQELVRCDRQGPDPLSRRVVDRVRYRRRGPAEAQLADSL